MVKPLINCVLLFFLALNGLGQTRFYTNISEGPLLPGQTFQIQYVAEGAATVTDLKIAPLRGFTLHDSFDSKSSFIPAPGQPLQQAWSRILVVSVTGPGIYIIPEATAFLDGKLMHCAAGKITVASSTAAPAPAKGNAEVPVDDFSVLSKNESPTEHLKGNLFLKTRVSKRTCYVGEGLEVNYKLYYRLNARSQVVRRPSLTGFSVVEMVDSYPSDPEVELLDGQPFFMNLVRKAQVFPMQAGTVLLDAAEVSSKVRLVRSASGKKGDLNQLIDPSAINEILFTTTVVSEPVSITVKPLPPLKDSQSFSGAIGSFTVTLAASRVKVAPGELVKLRIFVNGKGNLPLVVAPSVHWPAVADSAEPVVKEVYDKTRFPLQGYKSFEYTFTAPDSGTVHLSPVQFRYFDPVHGKYLLAVSEALDISVDANAKNESLILPVSTDPLDPGRPVQLYGFAIIAALIIGWILFQLFRGKSVQQQPAAAVVPESIPADPFENLFKRSRMAIGQPAAVFYRQLEADYWDALMGQFDMTPSEAYKTRLAGRMQERGFSTAQVQAVTRILEQCEWALYTGDGEAGTAKEDLLREAEAQISNLRR